jgi:glucosamine 6-phosphate synthetase-like amidotransferase/phosphosugar isomerase protein
LPGFRLGETLEVLSPLVAVLPLQLLACYLRRHENVNPDIFRMDVEPYAQPVKRFLDQKQF